MCRILLPTQITRQVMVGYVSLWAAALPAWFNRCSICPLADVEGNLESDKPPGKQAGCEVVRIAVPHKADLDFFEEICKKSPLPVVADIHFSAELAIEAARRGAAKLRINPGNIGGLEATVPVLQAAKAAGIPIRIGVNAGSLDSASARQRSDLTLPEKLVESATAYVEFCHGQGFYDRGGFRQGP